MGAARGRLALTVWDHGGVERARVVTGRARVAAIGAGQFRTYTGEPQNVATWVWPQHQIGHTTALGIMLRLEDLGAGHIHIDDGMQDRKVQVIGKRHVNHGPPILPLGGLCLRDVEGGELPAEGGAARVGRIGTCCGLCHCDVVDTAIELANDITPEEQKSRTQRHYTTMCCTKLHDNTLQYPTGQCSTPNRVTLPYTPLHSTLPYFALHDTTRHDTTRHYTTLHYTTLHYTTLHYTTLHYTTLHYTTLHYTTLHYTTLHYTTLHYTTLHYTTLHYTTLHYTTLHYTTLHCALHCTIALHYDNTGDYNVSLDTLHHIALPYPTLPYSTPHYTPRTRKRNSSAMQLLNNSQLMAAGRRLVGGWGIIWGTSQPQPSPPHPDIREMFPRRTTQFPAEAGVWGHRPTNLLWVGGTN